MKLIIALIVSMFSVGAFATDVTDDVIDTDVVTQEVEEVVTGQMVTERMSCAEIQAKIKELGVLEEPDTETIDQITKLKADYRRICSRAAGARRTSAGVRVVIEGAKIPKQEDLVKQDTQEEPKEIEEVEVASVAETESVAPEAVETEPELTLEQELANLDAGLCADGTPPNKYGCCAGEIFKDLGNTVFACCPKDGVGDCMPPLK